jgi:bifunctional DNA-binding transcriptional regulator/antitoxin component of YhaV-PrlF toxin-antitoxin module
MAQPTPRPYGPVLVRANGQVVPPALLREDLGLVADDRVTFFWWPGEKRVLMVIGEDPSAEGYEPVSSS